jgi:hypothetical protein
MILRHQKFLQQMELRLNTTLMEHKYLNQVPKRLKKMLQGTSF